MKTLQHNILRCFFCPCSFRSYSFLAVFPLLLLFLLPNSAFAEKSPSDVLREIVSKLKSSGNPAVIVDYVHWDSAFKQLSSQETELTGAKSPQELQNYFKKLLSDPGPILREQLAKHSTKLPAAQQQMLQAQIAKMASQIEQKFQAEKENLVKADYKIGEEIVTGDKATVEMKTSYGQEKREEKIPFIRVEETWYLPSVDKLSTKPTSSGGLGS